jgi:hypothetical protein
MKRTATLALFSALIPVSFAHAQVVATSPPHSVTLGELEAHHFMLAPQKRTTILASETEVLKTIDETLTMRRFASEPQKFIKLEAAEKTFYDLQLERAHLTAALAVVERRAREAFAVNDPVVIGRAREIWKLDENRFFNDPQADLTVIQFDSQKHSWVALLERIAGAQNVV